MAAHASARPSVLRASDQSGKMAGALNSAASILLLLLLAAGIAQASHLEEPVHAADVRQAAGACRAGTMISKQGAACLTYSLTITSRSSPGEAPPSSWANRTADAASYAADLAGWAMGAVLCRGYPSNVVWDDPDGGYHRAFCRAAAQLYQRDRALTLLTLLCLVLVTAAGAVTGWFTATAGAAAPAAPAAMPACKPAGDDPEQPAAAKEAAQLQQQAGAKAAAAAGQDGAGGGALSATDAAQLGAKRAGYWAAMGAVCMACAAVICARLSGGIYVGRLWCLVAEHIGSPCRLQRRVEWAIPTSCLQFPIMNGAPARLRTVAAHHLCTIGRSALLYWALFTLAHAAAALAARLAHRSGGGAARIRRRPGAFKRMVVQALVGAELLYLGLGGCWWAWLPLWQVWCAALEIGALPGLGRRWGGRLERVITVVLPLVAGAAPFARSIWTKYLWCGAYNLFSGILQLQLCSSSPSLEIGCPASCRTW